MKILRHDKITQVEDPIIKANVRSIILSYLFDYQEGVFPGPPAGFQAALYRDYVSGNYRLAFRGTEMTNWDGVNDWYDNIRQGVFAESAQYQAAILLAWAVSKLDLVREARLELTGHSLGGGLASAAAIANKLHADVFNGAGLNRNVLYKSDHETPFIPGTNPELADGELLINHFYIARSFDDHLNRVDTPDN